MIPSRFGMVAFALVLANGTLSPTTARAENLFVNGLSQSLSSDKRAGAKGDLITIVIVQAAESSTSIQNGSRKSSAIDGHVGIGSVDKGAGLSLNGSYTGRGESRRSERFATQLTAMITDILPNGDLMIGGSQHMNVNGENTVVSVRGRIRPIDIDSENRVPSNRIADAQISYEGKGFASRSARPGILQRIFGFLGLN